ncbi:MULTISPECIES: hypothetical protein [Siminovitchia]|uniref:Uncharacterized protein n=1 Tax=Siminovitchia sediminis TaxID=1274353 RepID=A0ABW4KGH5_9BACI|nr:hypothetical protein [Siminovitchia fortis]
MRNYLQNLKEDLELMSSEQATITVSRKDLEKLVESHEKLLAYQQDKEKKRAVDRER